MGASDELIFVDETASVVLDKVSMRYRVASSDASAMDESAYPVRVLKKLTGQVPTVTVHALNEMSLVVERGESVGVIGRNGSGKSTLMKLISGQMTASSGHIYASSLPLMLGVNAALNPELSGEQNIVLGCLAMGLDRYEIGNKFQSIVELSGLDKALHLPMKSYSSGMASRLRFAIAACVDPEILVIDEALNTGDAQFHDRSKRKMDELRANAGCVFLVSHSLDTVLSMCSRAIWVDEGDLVKDGSPREVIRDYRNFTGRLSRGRYADASELLNEIKADLVVTRVSERLSGRRSAYV